MLNFKSRDEILHHIPNKFDAVMAIAERVKMLADNKKRLIEENDENLIKIAMEEIVSGALEVDIAE